MRACVCSCVCVCVCVDRWVSDNCYKICTDIMLMQLLFFELARCNQLAMRVNCFCRPFVGEAGGEVGATTNQLGVTARLSQGVERSHQLRRGGGTIYNCTCLWVHKTPDPHFVERSLHQTREG